MILMRLFFPDSTASLSVHQLNAISNERAIQAASYPLQRSKLSEPLQVS